MVGIFSALCKEKLCKKRLTLCRIDDIIRSQKRKGQTPKAESPISQARATPARNFSEQMAKAKSFERGESNGNRRNILQVRGTRRGAVTETIKVIAIKKERGFQTTRTNRLKSAIGFWPKFARQLWGSDPLYEISGMTTDDEHGSRQRESKVRKQKTKAINLKWCAEW